MLPGVSTARLLPVLILGGLFHVASLRADVIYTNFGVGDTYASDAGLIVTHDGQAWSSVAVAFVPQSSYYLNSIEVVATDLFTDEAAVSIGVFADNGGQPGGTPIEELAFGGLGQFGQKVPLLTFTTQLNPLLLANTTYWIGLNASDGSMVVWDQNVTQTRGFMQSDGSGNWSASSLDQGALRINGTLASPASSNSDVNTVPEPATWLLLAGALALLAGKPGARFSHKK